MTPTALEERIPAAPIPTEAAPAATDAAATATDAVPPTIVERIVACHDQLAACPTLDPGPQTDRLFTELVRTCIAAPGVGAAAVLADQRLIDLRSDLLRICAEGEGRLETRWAQRVCASADPETELAAFPYIENYHRLVRLELGALAGAGWSGGSHSRIAFLGGGPLPLSALLTHRALDCRMDVIDNSPPAIRRAERLLARVQPGGSIRTVEADASRPSDMAAALTDCDLVIVAALVGMDRVAKRRVLRAVSAAVAPGTHVVIRSAAELRTMLYPDVSVDDVIAGGLTPVSLVHPMDEVVNSVWVTRR